MPLLTSPPIEIPDFNPGSITNIQPLDKGWVLTSPQNPGKVITVVPNGNGWTVFKNFDGDFDDNQ